VSTGPTLHAGSFYGAVTERWQTPLVTASLVRHERPRQVPPHSHEHMFVSLLLEGGYREWVAGRRIDYAPLTVVFHPEKLEHRDEILTANTLFFTVEVHPRLLAARDRRRRALSTVRDLTGGPAVWALLRLLDEMRRHRHDDLEGEEPVAELLDTLLGEPGETQRRPRWLDLVERSLVEGFREAVSLRALAEQAGVHPVHASRVFRRENGCTMRTFLHRQRVLHACRAILDGRRGLAAVATESGFCDQSHMTHVFRQVTGMTPTAYRRSVPH